MEGQAQQSSSRLLRPTNKETGKAMKRHIRNLAGVAMLLAAIAASGQLSHQLRVNVPFSFMAGRVTSPAGDYTVEVDRSRGLVTLRPYKSRSTLLLTTQSLQSGETRSYLRFRRYGERWFLREVTVEGVAQIVPMGKREKQFIAASTPPDNSKPIIVDIAVR
jgi:hypothetical protein